MYIMYLLSWLWVRLSQYRCNRLLRKARHQSDLSCVKCEVRLHSLTR